MSVAQHTQPRIRLDRVSFADADELIAAHLESRDYHAPWATPFVDRAGFETWFWRILAGPNISLVVRENASNGIVGLIKTLADELASDGIRVNGICPGWTRTDRVDQLLQDRASRQLTTPEVEAAKIAIDIPLGRMGTPEEFARAAAFLVSPAASYITGVSLLVDGGMYRGMM